MCLMLRGLFCFLMLLHMVESGGTVALREAATQLMSWTNNRGHFPIWEAHAPSDISQALLHCWRWGALMLLV